MALEIRTATIADIPALVGLMAAFYAESNFPLPLGTATRAFETLLAQPHLGAAWLAEYDGAAVGHVVMTIGFSMEYGGLTGVVDDLYVRPAMRGRGVGARLLTVVRSAATQRGMRALHVEVDPGDPRALRLYERAGYVDRGHLLLSLPLDAPIHAS